VLYNNYLQTVTLASSSIRTIGDLRGRTVSTGAPGSGTEVTAFRVLQAAGIDPLANIQKQSLGITESADALKDGKIDAFFWTSGLPAAGILDLSHTPGVGIRLLATEAALPVLQQTYGPSLYTVRPIPPNTYAGIEAPVLTISVANILAVHEEMPEQLAHDITRALFDYQADLIAIHPEARNLSLASAVEGSPAQFHPGAIRYYTAQNAWKQ
jgi:TRAP transporter TAXI family solute receptor